MSEIIIVMLVVVIITLVLSLRDERARVRKLENIILQLAIGNDTVSAVADDIRERRTQKWLN